MTTIREPLLPHILLQMCRTADTQRGQVQAHAFKQGASVKLYVTSERVFHFKVWRAGTYPGEVEWDTFIRYLPDHYRPEHTPEPELKESGGVYAFCAEWSLAVPEFGR